MDRNEDKIRHLCKTLEHIEGKKRSRSDFCTVLYVHIYINIYMYVFPQFTPNLVDSRKEDIYAIYAKHVALLVIYFPKPLSI